MDQRHRNTSKKRWEPCSNKTMSTMSGNTEKSGVRRKDVFEVSDGVCSPSASAMKVMARLNALQVVLCPCLVTGQQVQECVCLCVCVCVAVCVCVCVRSRET